MQEAGFVFETLLTGDCFAAEVAEMESDDDDDDEDVVRVNGQQVAYADVTPAMVQQMSEAEKAEYVRIGTRMYQDLYE